MSDPQYWTNLEPAELSVKTGGSSEGPWREVPRMESRRGEVIPLDLAVVEGRARASAAPVASQRFIIINALTGRGVNLLAAAILPP